MATPTVEKAEIEKVVRRVLAEERPDDGRATLKAIQRLSSLLTEQVIPNLPERDDDELDSDDGAGARSTTSSFASRSTPLGDDTNDDGPDAVEDDDSESEVPQPVMAAVETLYQALSPAQASALAEFFTAVSQEIGEDDEGTAGEDEETEADSNVA